MSGELIDGLIDASNKLLGESESDIERERGGMILYFSGGDTLGTALLVLPRDTRSHGTGRFGMELGLGPRMGRQALEPLC